MHQRRDIILSILDKRMYNIDTYVLFSNNWFYDNAQRVVILVLIGSIGRKQTTRFLVINSLSQLSNALLISTINNKTHIFPGENVFSFMKIKVRISILAPLTRKKTPNKL